MSNGIKLRKIFVLSIVSILLSGSELYSDDVSSDNISSKKYREILFYVCNIFFFSSLIYSI